MCVHARVCAYACVLVIEEEKEGVAALPAPEQVDAEAFRKKLCCMCMRTCTPGCAYTSVDYKCPKITVKLLIIQLPLASTVVSKKSKNLSARD